MLDRVAAQVPPQFACYVFDTAQADARPIRTRYGIGMVPRIITFAKGRDTGRIFLLRSPDYIAHFFAQLHNNGRVAIQPEDAEAVARFYNRCIRLLRRNCPNMQREQVPDVVSQAVSHHLQNCVDWYNTNDEQLLNLMGGAT